MVFACEACSFEYISDRGLRQHQLNCEEFLQADNEASTVDNALEKYQRKLQRKKQKAALSEVLLTGSGVCYSIIFYLYMILIIHCRMQIRPLQTRISHWNQNLNVKPPPPNNNSQNPSHFQPSVEPDPEINAAGHAFRKKRLTWKLLQQLPAPPSPLPEPVTAFIFGFIVFFLCSIIYQLSFINWERSNKTSLEYRLWAVR